MFTKAINFVGIYTLTRMSCFQFAKFAVKWFIFGGNLPFPTQGRYPALRQIAWFSGQHGNYNVCTKNTKLCMIDMFVYYHLHNEHD